MSARARSVILASGLALTVLLSYGVSERESPDSATAEAVVLPSRTVSERKIEAVGDTMMTLPVLGARVRIAGTGEDLLRSTTWLTPMSNVPIAVAPVMPPAPPLLPYLFRGIFSADGRVIGIVEKQGEQSHIRVGEVLDSQYRVDDITAEGVKLMYLPLNITQVATMQDPR